MRRMMQVAMLLAMISAATSPAFSQTNPDLHAYFKDYIGLSVVGEKSPLHSLTQTSWLQRSWPDWYREVGLWEFAFTKVILKSRLTRKPN
jgi:hypothetical protein